MGGVASKAHAPPPPRCVLITGASSGLGAALALEFAAPAVKLVLIGRNNKRLVDAATLCEARGAKVECAMTDVTDRKAMAELILKVELQAPIDLLIANAGVMCMHMPLAEALQATVATNIQGTINTIAPALDAMLRRGSGHIAIMSSISSIPDTSVNFAGLLQLGFLPYAWTKHALLHLARGLSAEVAGKGIAISAVCPPIVDTPMARTAAAGFGCSEQLSHTSLKAADAAVIIRKGLLKQQEVIAFPTRILYNFRLLSLLPNKMIARQLRGKFHKTEGVPAA